MIALKNRDYEYRAFVRREQWEYAIVALTADIAYGNFKHEVEVRQGKRRAGIYLRIWGAALGIAPTTRNRKQRSLFGRV